MFRDHLFHHSQENSDSNQLEEALLVVSKNEVVHRIEQIDTILTILQELRRSEIEELETIEAKESA